MTTVEVVHATSLGEDEIRRKIREVLGAAWDEHKVLISETAGGFAFSREGVRGQVEVTGGKVQITMDLEGLLVLFKTRIVRELQERLAAALP